MDPFSAALGIGGIASNIISNFQNQSNFEEQLNFQRYQYEDSKRYNSLRNQIRQMRANGINPALQGGQQPSQVSAMSAPSPNPMNPLDMNGLAAISSGINLNDVQADNIKANTANTNVETEANKVDLGFKTQDWLSKLYNRDADSWYKDMMSRNVKLNNTFLERSMVDRLHQQKMEAQEAQAHAYAQHYLLPYVPLRAQAELDNLAANTKLALDSGVATLKQAFAAIMNAESTKKSIEAQYGDNPQMRKQFAEATYKFLTQRIHTSESEEFRNVNGLQGVMGTGIKFVFDDHYRQNWRSKD